MSVRLFLRLASAAIAAGLVAACSSAAAPGTPSSFTPSSSPQPTSSTGPHYTLAEPGIVLGGIVQSKVGEIANCYFGKTGKDLVLTSGTRSEEAQAEAMFNKLNLGDPLAEYVNQKAAGEVKEAYEKGVMANKTPAEIIGDMAAVIEVQTAAGTYLSRHLQAGAVDFRSRDMTDADKTAFRTCAAASANVRVLEEGTPPHFHLQVATESPDLTPTPTATAMPTATSTPTPVPTPSPTPTRTPTPAPTPAPTPSPTPTRTPTPTPTPTLTPTPTATPTPGPKFSYYSGSLTLNVEYQYSRQGVTSDTQSLSVNATFSNLKVQVAGPATSYTPAIVTSGSYQYSCSSTQQGSSARTTAQGTVGGNIISASQTGDILSVLLFLRYNMTETSATRNKFSFGGNCDGTGLPNPSLGQLAEAVTIDLVSNPASRTARWFTTTQFSPPDGGDLLTHPPKVSGDTIRFTGRIHQPGTNSFTYDYFGTLVLRLDRTE